MPESGDERGQGGGGGEQNLSSLPFTGERRAKRRQSGSVYACASVAAFFDAPNLG